MKAAVTVFPGSNCDRDMAVALRAAGADVAMVWHREDRLPEGTDLVAVPGGFSFGDYLRCGAIAARSPIAAAVRRHAERGGYVLGVCNGFQILLEMGLLPGALMRNAGLRFVCRTVSLTVEGESDFTRGYARQQRIRLPVAHHDGNYFADAERSTGWRERGASPSAMPRRSTVRHAASRASCRPIAASSGSCRILNGQPILPSATRTGRRFSAG
ncbi:phosphoribosylformylglycinamidine synthase I [Rubellimicrobium thermophilum DSM 16684]|uniref:Phosphoribosylformylglycinamidine synthase I n=1 Tax=Rubellimicrobium thermophilum DSM 16684 TaxID=1123069 RepID=S9QYL9_9RHOB|nr:phosphoribosylformylglycinamidine synthase I [Rubellimicrobium thermophilum DSM 16684]